MKLKGYKLNGYDATYESAVFDVTDIGNNLVRITDILSGVSYILELEKAKGSNIRTWYADNLKVKGGKHIHLGKST